MCVLCFLCQTSDFLPLTCSYARLRLSLFLFAYVRFVLFVLAESFRKRHKTPPIPSFTILPNISSPQYVFITAIHFHYLNTFLSPPYIFIITIHFHYDNIFSLLQCVFTITIHFHYYNTFSLLQYIFITTIFFNHHDLYYHDFLYYNLF